MSKKPAAAQWRVHGVAKVALILCLPRPVGILLTATHGGTGADTIDADSGSDTMFGNVRNDTMFGGFGDDWISGNAGNDRIDGGQGADVLFGGQGVGPVRVPQGLRQGYHRRLAGGGYDRARQDGRGVASVVQLATLITDAGIVWRLDSCGGDIVTVQKPVAGGTLDVSAFALERRTTAKCWLWLYLNVNDS